MSGDERATYVPLGKRFSFSQVLPVSQKQSVHRVRGSMAGFLGLDLAEIALGYPARKRMFKNSYRDHSCHSAAAQGA